MRPNTPLAKSPNKVWPISPIGVVSKNEVGEFKTAARAFLYILKPAFSPTTLANRERHARQVTDNWTYMKVYVRLKVATASPAPIKQF